MKFMTRKWLVRPVALLLMAMLMMTEPVMALADEQNAKAVSELAAVASTEETSAAAEGYEEGDLAVPGEEAALAAESESESESESETESPSETETEAPEIALKDALKDYVLTVKPAKMTWTGKELKPAVTLVNKGTEADIPVTVNSTKYSNNINVGNKAKVSVVYSAEGYTGTASKTAYFTIVPAKATGIKVVSATTSEIKASADAVSTSMKKGISTWKYEWKLMRYDASKGKLVTVRTKTTTKNACSFDKLSSAVKYKIKVCYVAVADQNKLKGDYSKLVEKTTNPMRAKLTAATKTGAKSMLVKWNKVARATGYQIQYANNKSFTKAGKVTTYKSTAVSKKVTDMKYTDCVYVRVRAMRKVETGKFVYGKWSNIRMTNPEEASVPSAIARSEDSLTVKSKTAATTGVKYQFRLYKYDADKKSWLYKTSMSTKETKVTFTGLNAGSKYKATVRYFYEANSKKYFGKESGKKLLVTKPAKVTINSAVKQSGQKLKVSWTPVAYGSGYEVQWSTSSKFTNASSSIVTGITKSTRTVDLASSSDYYARVRAYVVLNGKKIYGSWSDTRYTSYANVYSSYVTYYDSGNYNRSTNLRLACQALNGTILQPGDTFSFNGIVGERTAGKGYREAIIYEGGQQVGGIGGGICQVATTFFNAALKANFKINERYQHSMTVHYAPLGYDAAIAWGSKNLRFTNNSGVPIKIYSVASGGVLTVKFLSNVDAKPPKVSTSVSVSNRVYTLKRYVNGVCNYTTTSKYLDR